MSDGGAPLTGAVSGTAASGKAIAGARVTLKGSDGQTKTATTDGGGKFTLDASDVRAPFLLRVELAGGGALFSVGNQAGVVNIHPFTDLVVASWYKVQGKSTSDGFTDPAATPPPGRMEVKVIAALVMEIVAKWLADNGLDPTRFDLFGTPFDADARGFDKVLDGTQVNTTSGMITIKDHPTSPTVTQQSMVSYDVANTKIEVSTTTTAPSGTTSTTSGAVVPTKPALQQAMAGTNATLARLKETVLARGQALTDADCATVIADDYLHDGKDKSLFAADMATFLRGLPITAMEIERVVDYQDATKVLTYDFVVAFDVGGQVQKERQRFVAKLVGASWLLWGNRHIADVDMQVEMRSNSGGEPYKRVNVPRRGARRDVVGGQRQRGRNLRERHALDEHGGAYSDVSSDPHHQPHGDDACLLP
jgi:hypothetical protein